MKQQNDSVKEIEIGKDYVNVHDNKLIVIDRVGDLDNKGFYDDLYKKDIPCTYYGEWRETTKEEVIEAFKKHLVHRYGKDWKAMKIKESHPNSSSDINDGSWNVVISKFYDGWVVYNENGMLYYDDIWVERLEEENESVKKLEIGKDYISLLDSNTIVIDRCGDYFNKGFYGTDYLPSNISCSYHLEDWREATKEEVIEAFEKHLPHRFGEDWRTMKIKEKHPSSNPAKPINDNSYGVEISKFYDGWVVWNENGLLYCNGIWVERLEESVKPSDWTPAPEDIKEIKAGEKVDKRYALKRDVLTILSVESKLNPDKKISEYLEQFKLILEVL